MFADAPALVAVVFAPVASDKIPEREQLMSAGAVAMNLLHAAHAAGWGANWLTGWLAHDRTFCAAALDLAQNERIAGFVHIGTESAAPPERPRPDLDRIVTWLSE
jgi:nitroreductase